MMSLATRSGAFSSYMQATAVAVASPLKALVPGVVVNGEKILLNPKKQFLCRESLTGQSPKTGPAVTVSVNGCAGVRFAHTDIRVPDFSDYRRPEVLDPNKSSQDSSEYRRTFSYLFTGATTMFWICHAFTLACTNIGTRTSPLNHQHARIVTKGHYISQKPFPIGLVGKASALWFLRCGWKAARTAWRLEEVVMGGRLKGAAVAAGSWREVEFGYGGPQRFRRISATEGHNGSAETEARRGGGASDQLITAWHPAH
ncbi:Cytochrome b-c1 complex subunit Rieske [Nibea albiflora]|uniref:Cytochrome b-c1 complex subunit Rieske n=1 Tax=Nibea albiflora TaxID=240163 RepID=A0ACB7EFQ9_NIBAL|nr:Cytochrome b-c1 complex subunit Rieske [Nibea albiflora]